MQTHSLHYCTKPSLSIAANVGAMQQTQGDHELIKSLVDWAANGIVSRVAAAIGVSPSTLNRHYNGSATTKLGRDTVAKLRERYPDFPGWGPPVRSEVAGFGSRPLEEKFGGPSLKDIPVWGSAIGMESFDPERDIETTELTMSEALGYVQRPSSLANDDGAYAVTVVGDSMWPRFRPGRRVIVSPKAPVSIGDDVIVQLRTQGVQTAATNLDPVTLVLIKELVRRTSRYLELRQFNPDVAFRVEAERVAAIHKVIGEVF